MKPVLMLMLMLMSLLLVRLLKQTTNNVPDHTKQASSRSTASLTLRLPAGTHIVRSVKSRMIPLTTKLARRRPVPLEVVDILFIRVRRVPRVVIV